MARTITGRRINSLLKLADSYGVTLDFIGKDNGIVRVTSQAGTSITMSHISLWYRWADYLDSITIVIKLLSEDVKENES